MTSLITAIGEGSSIRGDVLGIQRAFPFRQPLFLGWPFISGKAPVRSHISHHPTTPAFRTTETVFTLSFNEDISKQLGNK